MRTALIALCLAATCPALLGAALPAAAQQSGDTSMGKWGAEILRKLQDTFTPRGPGRRIDVHLRLVVSRSGELRSIQLLEGSQVASLSKRFRDEIFSASPFPAYKGPAVVDEKSFAVTVRLSL